MHDSPDFDLDSRLRRREDVPWKQLEDTVLLLDLTNGDFFELDPVGARIWMGLDGERMLGELALALAEEYEVAVETARSDVLAFVIDLYSKGLVVRGVD
jgi:hypothetical protein